MQTIDLTDVEFDLIVATMDQDELKCEMTHVSSVCSVEVTHRKLVGCNGAQYNVCQTAYQVFCTEAVTRPRLTHDKCGDRVTECWSYRAI